MEKVVVDQDKCIGCGFCVRAAEDVFDFDEDTHLSKVIKNEVNDQVLEAKEGCPVEAIDIVNED